MKLNKMQLEALASTVVETINAERQKKKEALIKSESIQSKIQEKIDFLQSFSKDDIYFIKNCIDFQGNINKTSIQNFVLKDVDMSDVSSIITYGSTYNLIKNEIVLSSIKDIDTDQLIANLVKKFM